MARIDYPHEVHKLIQQNNIKISCVIPAFCEGPRIEKVLDVVTVFPLFSDIVLVNDGSTDNTLEVMRRYEAKGKNVVIIDLKKNGGKTKAVIEGIKKTKGELICLIDADLSGLKYEFLYKMIYYVLNGEFSMTILDREGDQVSPLGFTQSWVSRFNGGERAFWKRDWKKMKFGKNAKYVVEQVMNLYYLNAGLKVRTIWCPGLYGAYQMRKKGWIKGLQVYRKMFSELYKHSRVKGFYIQIENIVEDRIEPLYKLKERTKMKKAVTGVIMAAGLLTSISAFVYFNLKRVTRRPS